MTRAQTPDSQIDYRSAGAAGAARTVVVLRRGALALNDPDPAATAAGDVRLLLLHLDDAEIDDPPAFGGETPAQSTAQAIADLVAGDASGPWAIVAERETSALAFAVVARAGGTVDRVALVAPEPPGSPLARDVLAQVLAGCGAEVLVVAADTDPASVDGARWFAATLADCRRAEVARSDVHSPDGRLGLGDAWPQVLAHVAAGVTP
jgi:hypothetical protein